MRHSTYILLTLCILLYGCRGYIGGLDDSNTQIVQLVFMNRSSHDIEIIIKDPAWSVKPDTIRLEKGNGLWKRNFGSEYAYTNHYFDEAEIVVEGGERFLFEGISIPYSPCSLKPLSDSKGVYYIYDFNEKAYMEIRQAYEDLRKFTMNDVPPSYILPDTLITAGSSEALFKRLYPANSVKESLRLGSVIGREAERIDKIRVYEEDGIVPGNVEVNYDKYSGGRKDRPCFAYYSIEELRKAGLAHFGCDFGEITGREELDGFSGCLYSSMEVRRRESLQETQETSEFRKNISDDKAIVQSITYGNVKILLAEADCMHEKLMHYLHYNVLTDYGDSYYYVPDVKYYLLSLDENGSFQCKSGGLEIVSEWLDVSEAEPVVAIDYSVTDSSGSSTFVHIYDVAI